MEQFICYAKKIESAFLAIVNQEGIIINRQQLKYNLIRETPAI